MAEEKKETEKPAADNAKAEKAEKAKKAAQAAKDKKAAGAIPMTPAGEIKVSPGYTPRLEALYKEKVIATLQKEFNFKSPMQVPNIQKVVLNCAVKEAVGNPKVLENTYDEMMAITGQKPVYTKSKKAIAAFKIRAGIPLAVSVTLRRARMWEFLDRLLNVALPRVRDFRGVNPKSFDGRGNYSLGIREQIIFPEVNYDKVDKIRGMTITIQTSAKTNEHARSLLKELGMPFRKN